MIKESLTIAMLLITAIVMQAQNRPTISLVDVHNANVTGICMHSDGTCFATADEKGKIILWETKNFGYIRTLSEGNQNQPVHQMRFSADGQSLMTTEGWQGRADGSPLSERYTTNSPFAALDSMCAYSISGKEYPQKVQISADILGHPFDSSLLIAAYQNGNSVLIGYSNGNTKLQMFAFASALPVSAAHVHEGSKLCAAVEHEQYTASGNAQWHLVVKNFSGNEMFNKTYNQSPVAVYFDNDANLHVFINDYKNRKIVIESYNTETFSIFSTKQFEFTSFKKPFIYLQNDGNTTAIVADAYSKPLVLKLEGNRFMPMYKYIDNPGNITAASFINGSSQMILFGDKHPYYGNNPPMTVIDIGSGSFLDKYARPSRNNIRACYLPENNWYVEGYEPNYNRGFLSNPLQKFIKLYASGSFNNKYGRLHLKDHLEIHHGIQTLDNTEFIVDESSAYLIIAGYKKNAPGTQHYFVFDMIGDRVIRSFPLTINRPYPLMYSASSGRLLAAHLRDFAGCRDYVVLDGENVWEMSGRNTDAVLSHSGEFIMLTDTAHVVSIYKIGEKKPVFRKELGNAFGFKSGAGEENDFWISYTVQNKGERSWTSKSVLFGYHEEMYSEMIYDNVLIQDFTVKNEKVVMIIQGAMNTSIITGDNDMLAFTGSSLPTKVSLNDDTDRIMVTFNNGSVAVYSYSGIQPLASMIHPDNQKHVMVSTEGYYSANFDASQHLVYTGSNEMMSRELIMRQYHRPEKVLEAFGKPNPNYLKVLQKTMEIKNTSQAIHQPQATNKPPVLQSLTVNKADVPAVWHEPNLPLALVVQAANSDIVAYKTETNGVATAEIILKKSIAPNTMANINIDLQTVDGGNYISLFAIDDNKNEHVLYDFYFYKPPAKELPDLYLLAIGVSEYQRSEYNLSFADKDAYDLAMLYGKNANIDTSYYRNRFYGLRYSVAGENTGHHFGEIRQFRASYSSSDFYSVDYIGRYWIENSNDSFFLWDFTTSSCEPIELPEIVIDRYTFELLPAFIASPDNDGFYYRRGKGNWRMVSFASHSFSKNTYNNLHTMPLIQGSRYVSMRSRAGDNNYYGNVNNTYEVQLCIHSFNNKADSVSLPALVLEGIHKTPELLAASGDGNVFLFTDDINLIIAQKIGSNFNVHKIEALRHEKYSNTYSFGTNQKLGILRNIGSEYVHYCYTVENGAIDSSYVNNSRFNLHGISNNGAVLRWIDSSEPIAQTDYKYFSEDRASVHSKLHPKSFARVHVKTITNHEATCQDINEAIPNFFAQARPGDQAMVFIAGHGVLDNSMNYYFAPSDMDFDNPHKNGISYHKLIYMLRSIPATRRLLILDSCHSGDIYEREQRETVENDTVSGKRGGKRMKFRQEHVTQVGDIMELLFENTASGAGITVISASSGTDVAYESKELSNGALTASIIDCITATIGNGWGGFDENDNKPVSLSDDITYRIMRGVIAETKAKQIPNLREVNRLSDIRLW